MDYYTILFHRKNNDRVPLKGDFYECLFAGATGWKIVTIEGVPPIYFASDGTELTAYEISGNMVQNGTPTPTTPVQKRSLSSSDLGNHDEPNANWQH